MALVLYAQWDNDVHGWHYVLKRDGEGVIDTDDFKALGQAFIGQGVKRRAAEQAVKTAQSVGVAAV